MKILIIISILSVSLGSSLSNNEIMLEKVNKLRQQGCTCGNIKMKPVGNLAWNDTLEYSAFRYARHMRRFNLFSHLSIDGKDVGERLDEFGYRWQFAGENLGEGQESFDEVLKDWLKSESHCKMLMNPNMNETGIAYFRGIWVQHFGKQLAEDMKRKDGTVKKEH